MKKLRKIYAFSDLHGSYDLWKRIQNYLGENDIAYCLGDSIDRGIDGIKILKEMLADPRIIMLIGNHEKMMIDAITSISEWEYDINSKMDLWLQNGGRPTLDTIKEDIYKGDFTLIEEIKRLQYNCLLHINNRFIFLSHAGVPIEFLDEIKTNPAEFRKMCIWSRDHFFEEWKDEYPENLYIVHGHTPTLSYPFHSVDPEIARYAKGHKIDIDVFSCVSGVAALLDLETLEPIYIRLK